MRDLARGVSRTKIRTRRRPGVGDPRPRLRRPAAVRGVRRRRASRVTGFDLSAEKVAAVNRGESYIKDVPSERVGRAASREGRLRGQQRLRRAGRVRRGHHLRAHAAQQDQGPRPHDGRGRRQGRSPTRLRPGQLVVLESTTYPGHHRGADPAPARGARASRWGSRSSWPSRPSASIPGNARFDTRNTPKIIGGMTPTCTRVAQALYAQGHRHRDPGLLHPDRGDGEAAREHLPQREHRPRERGRAHVRPAGRGRVGGDRRRGHQALRLHALLSRARAWAATASPSTPSTCPGS